MTKKRNKKYHPKPVRVASIVYRANPLTAGERAEADVFTFAKLDALRRGEGTYDDCTELQRALYHAWVLARGFEEKWDMRLLFTIAFACLNALQHCFEQGIEPRPCVFEPIEQALEIFQEMKDALDRTELVNSLRALQDNREVFFNIPSGAGFVVGPNCKQTDLVLKRRGAGIVNGKLRSGYLQRNPEMNNRLEWVCPLEDGLVVPVTHEFVVLLTEPLKSKGDRR
ncbi:MAG: hypothetical protein SOV61_00955 [Lachnospiraceae bacterium]|nr:hypothetical protein [Lachnospiraceae bacterium]